MRRIWTLTLCAFAISFAWSASADDLTKEDFAANREAIVKSPALLEQVIAGCASDLRQDPKMIDMSVRLTGAPRERGPDVYCERTMKAMRDGRLTYERYVAASNDLFDAEMFRIVQGR